jgi:hypothetical protein
MALTPLVRIAGLTILIVRDIYHVNENRNITYSGKHRMLRDAYANSKFYISDDTEVTPHTSIIMYS